MFDLETAAVFAISLSLIQVLVTALFTMLTRSYKGTWLWTLAGGFLVVGTCFYSLRGVIPELYSVVVANSVNILALSCLYYGVRQFLHLTTSFLLVRLLFALPLFVALFIYYFTAVDNSIVIRSTFMSLVTVVLMAPTIHLLFQKSPRAVRRSHWFTATIFILFTLFNIGRLVPFWVGMSYTDASANDLLLVLPLVVTSLFGSLWTAGIALMITERLVVELQFTASHDFLTTVLTRREGQSQLETKIHNARQHHQPLSILLMDVDHFKSINDRYGHDAGDAVLGALVERLKRKAFSDNHLARWGGEEFLMMLPATTTTVARHIAEEINGLIAATPILVNNQAIACSVSIGVATAEPATADITDLLRCADRALYHAKHAGRNTVSVYHPSMAEVAA